MATINVSQAIGVGWAHHQHGRLADAEKIYREILTASPQQPDALQLLGLLASQVGQPQTGIDLINQAIAINPTEPLYHCNLAQVLFNIGRHDQAINSFQNALRLRPDMIQATVNLGNVHLATGQIQDAINWYHRAIKLNPNLPEPHNNLANAFHQNRQLHEAIAEYRLAISLKPDLADAHYNLATVLKEVGHFDEAMESFRAAIALRPIYPEAHNNLGDLYLSLGCPEQSEAEFRLAIEQAPNFAKAHSNLGNAMRDQGKLDEAIRCYHRAMELAPDWKLPRYNYALTLLLQGDLQRGWQEHEARRRALEVEIFIRDFPQPTWDGSDLNGRTILVHSEQGYGDVIQFARYVPMVAARGGRVIFQCQAQLIRVFQSLKGVDQFITRQDPPPDFDVHCPLLTLPLLFKTNSIKEIPAAVPYLSAESVAIEQWGQRLEHLKRKVKVGLVWSGRIHPPGRSVPLSVFAALARFPDIALISLQYGEAAAQTNYPPEGLNIASFTDDLKDFADTAALLENLDLLITIDTAAAHLAGAMAKPVWVLLPWLPDWRWLMNRQDSPWYPTMQLYRQPTRGDFQTPIEQILNDLPEFIRRITPKLV